jgi:hypothetical protein
VLKGAHKASNRSAGMRILVANILAELIGCLLAGLRGVQIWVFIEDA